LPKYHEIFGPGFFVTDAGARRREEMAEKLPSLHESRET